MKSSKNLRKYKKPLIKEYGNIKEITLGAWPSTDNDGTEGFYGSE